MPVPGAVTDPSLVTESSTTVTAEDGHAVPVHAARPSRAEERLPGLVVIHEAFGVNDHIRDVCRRFAAQGFVAAAPDLFARVGGPPPPGAMQEAMRRIGAMSDPEAVADLRATVAWLREQPGCSGRVGCIGFCMGGRLSLLLATHPGVLDRAIDCWGGRITRRTATVDERHPDVVVERVADRLDCPLLGVFGADDQNPDASDVEELRVALDVRGLEHRVLVYPDAGHAFFADYRPTYREGPAQAAWTEFLRFLEPLRTAGS